MFSTARSCALAGLLLVALSAQSPAQDKLGDSSPNAAAEIVNSLKKGEQPDTLKGIITVLKPGEQPDAQTDAQTDISENSLGDLRLRSVARPDPADPYGHISYLLTWRQGANEKLPVALIISSRPEARAVDYDLWRQETGLRDNGQDGHSKDFARRGYLAAWTMLPHEMVDLEFSDCKPEVIAAVMERGASRIQRILEALRREPEADMRHVVIVANGATAIAALVLATHHVDGLAGVINVSGGLYLPDCDARTINDVIGKILDTSGASPAVPSLWLYADNDEAFDQMTVTSWREAYIKSGGDVDLASIGMDHKPGYLLDFLPTSVLKITPHLNGFLDHLGLPAVHERDVDKLVIRLGGEEFRDTAREYLMGPSFKALAVSRSGKWIGTDFSETADVPALAAAMHDCNQRSDGEGCRIVMLNNDYQ